MPQRKLWNNLRPIPVSPYIARDPLPCLCSLQLCTKVERLGSQPHSPLPTLWATAHTSTHFVALQFCRRVAGNGSPGILGELQLQLFCFTAKKLQQNMSKNEHVHAVTPPLLQSSFMLWKAEISVSHTFNEKTKEFKRKILNLRFCTVQLMPRQAEVLISLAVFLSVSLVEVL